ncbi:MAG: UDP-N-acetylmuramoyl-tripeptide--D-alanyl-D-alanine ligase [Ruminococcaceae bacterium]|nr:UDP-N-acetylmuramoyl-tripeptide--D-alanyl-D-alanine ligase [Oscillospiraceae bacterium]
MGIQQKRKIFDTAELAGILGLETSVCADITGIVTDSREAESGVLFIALKGERVDGHDYIAQAITRGAAAVIAERMPDELEDEAKERVFVTKSSLEAFGKIAKAYKQRIHPRTIAVTGSVGKTTTKEFIYAVAGARFTAHKTAGNFNSEIGMPLTVLDMPERTQVCVLEMGMSELGEISRMTRIAEPDIAVITNIGNSHIENLGSRENICKAKMEIVEGVPENGWVILNADEPMLFAQKGRLTQNLLFVSLQNPQADYRALNIREYEDSTEFDLLAGKRVVTNVRIPTIGRHNVYDATYAFAVGILLGMSDEEIKSGLLSFHNTGMRQNIYEYGGITVIEDCYNAGPESMKAAVEVLAKMADKTDCRTIAVLGDMRELGEYSKQLHMEVGTLVASRHISHLVTFGREAENIALGAINHALKPDNISINTNTENPNITAKVVYELVHRGDAVLFKASRAVRLERVIEELKRLIDADPVR